jgi:chromosome condensin MukBEF complex kleisin-like MukF subunit
MGGFLFPEIILSGDMQSAFSQELRDRLKAYFQERHALTVSDEEADFYLDSLADVYGLFEKLPDGEPPP